MGRSAWLPLAVLALIPLVATACGGTEEKAERSVETVLVTAEDYAFGGDIDKLHASTALVTFRNQGALNHELRLFRLPGDKTGNDFLNDLRPLVQSEEGLPIPGYFFDPGALTGTGEVGPGENATFEFSLTEGRWLMFCSLTDADTEANDDSAAEGASQGQTDDAGEAGAAEQQVPPPHFDHGMFKVVDVEGSADPSPPTRGSAITAVEGDLHFGFEGTDSLKAGEQDIAILNDDGNKEIHQGILLEFPRRVTPKDVPEIVGEFLVGAADEGRSPGVAGGSAVFTPGFGGTFTAKLKAGRTYAFVCFMNDIEGGFPHAVTHNMMTPFRVPS